MAQPTFNGRLLPPQDWEGDDATPGAHGAYVTCQDTATGRMLYYATDGEVDLRGPAIRAAIQPQDSDGVSLAQVAFAVADLTKPSRVLQWGPRTLPDVRSWLDAGLGLVMDGYYGAIPAAFRHQSTADFAHALFIAYRKGPTYRVWDPLNKDTGSFGEDIPGYAIEPFIRSLSGLSGHFTLEPILPPAEGNPMMNLMPTTAHRVVDLAKGTILEKVPGGAPYTTLSAPVTLGVLSATGTHYYVADGDAGVYVLRSKVLAVRTEDKNVGV